MTHKKFIAIILAFVLGACLFIPLMKHTSSKDIIAEVESDGKLIKTVNLSRVDAGYRFDVVSKYGKNTVCVNKNEISVCDGDCPDKLCVKTGIINNSSVPIVCLPNKLVIKIINDKSSDNSPIITR